MAVPSPTYHVAHFEGVLGTSMELQTVGTAEGAALAEESALVEIDRLEAIFSLFREGSELLRWERTHREDVPVSPELAEVLALAESWRERTRGAFDPVMGPEPGPRWTVRGETARRLTPRKASLNALAKGYIVDRAAAAAFASPGVAAVLLNVGGDLRHLGPAGLKVAVADPFAPHENAPPVASVVVRNQGVATSGAYRRGAHLIDPGTGQPAQHAASATVVAQTAADADALATACFVLPPREALALADREGVALLLVLSNHHRRANRAWRRLV